MNTRNYNRIYTKSNRAEGSEKILLGYQNSGKEIVFAKDKETYFHVPYYTESLALSATSLIVDGAIPGRFPAASDKIFKNRKNYGNVTPYGNPSDIADGLWFCSWLYKDDFGNVQWLDRFYNPGRFEYSVAYQQLFQTTPNYVKSDPVFTDVPSRLVFEPGVLYKYHHVGEKNAQTLVTTFGGLSSERLVLNLSNWGEDVVDTTNNNYVLEIQSKASRSELYPELQDSSRVKKPILSFDNNKDINISLKYNEKYALTEEFTLAAFVQSNDWQASPSTQLFGNMTSRGGFGVFIETLSSFPFYVIPETSYGHLLYINESNNVFLDHSVQLTSQLTATPEFITIDFDNNVYVANNDNTATINKFDNFGKLIGTTKQTPFQFSSNDEVPVQILGTANDGVVLLTTKAVYTFDTNLNLVTGYQWGTTSTTKAAYEYNSELGTYTLIIKDNVLDVKFIEDQEWYISSVDKNLYRQTNGDPQPELFAQFANGANTFGIDPFNRIWVLHGTNKLSLFNASAEPEQDPILEIEVGFSTQSDEAKYISFFCAYDRNTLSKEWKCLIHYSKDSNIYILDMDGNLIQTRNLLGFFNPTTISALNQNSEKFTFFGKGDLTGYEYKRVFSKLPPYNNKPQVILKTRLKDKTKQNLSFVPFKQFASIEDWDATGWQHIVLALKNRTFTLYSNAQKLFDLSYDGKYELSYELRPSLLIGTSGGSQIGFNQELGSVSSIFNGNFEDVKIYDYAVDPKNLELFLRASLVGVSVVWTLPVPSIQYIEKIERMFKNKLPGAKSSFYQIKIVNSKITDIATRNIIEKEIKSMIQDLQPSYTDLIKIVWIDT